MQTRVRSDRRPARADIADRHCTFLAILGSNMCVHNESMESDLDVTVEKLYAVARNVQRLIASLKRSIERASSIRQMYAELDIWHI